MGTFELLGLAALVGVPIGVLGGVYLAEYGTVRANWLLRFVADVLNGVPSIIWGVVVYGLVVLRFKSFSAYAGGLALGFMMVPLIMRTTEEVILLVPNGYREAALALGISRWKTIALIVMKTASKGIITGDFAGAGPGRRRNRAAAFHGFWKPFLESQFERTDCRPAPPDLYLRHLALRRLAPASLGRRPGPRRYDFFH